MNEIVTGILMVAAILGVCGLYFKLVIMNWLAHDRAVSEEAVHRTEAAAAAKIAH